MATRMRRGMASGSGEWLLSFLQTRDAPQRRQYGAASGPGEWLLVFLQAARPERPVALERVARGA
jgi:hypothetical protein